VHGALVQWYWPGKTEVLRKKKPVPLPIFSTTNFTLTVLGSSRPDRKVTLFLLVQQTLSVTWIAVWAFLKQWVWNYVHYTGYIRELESIAFDLSSLRCLIQAPEMHAEASGLQMYSICYVLRDT
jgi:hypothetical protein